MADGAAVKGGVGGWVAIGGRYAGNGLATWVERTEVGAVEAIAGEARHAENSLTCGAVTKGGDGALWVIGALCPVNGLVLWAGLGNGCCGGAIGAAEGILGLKTGADVGRVARRNVRVVGAEVFLTLWWET